MTTAALWRTFRSTWWWLVLGVIVGLLAALLALQFMPKTYTASSTVLVDATSTDPGNSDLSEYVTKRLPNYVAIAGADDTVAQIAQKEGSTPEDVKGRLSYSVAPEGTVMTVQATGSSADVSQRTAKDAASVLSQKITSSSTPTITMSATVLEAATPGAVTSPKTSIVLATGALLGLLLSFLAALLRGFVMISHDRGTHRVLDDAERLSPAPHSRTDERAVDAGGLRPRGDRSALSSPAEELSTPRVGARTD